jgi:hypothetical protein
MALADYIFSPTGAGGLPTYEALERRRRIAAEIAARRSPAPKTIGEGLSFIGEAIGDRRIMDEAARAEEAQRSYQAGRVGAAPGGTEPAYTPYSPTAPPPAAAAPATPAAGPRADAGDDPWPARSRAIAGIESNTGGDPYAALGSVTKSGDRAYGKYQVMGNNVPEWSQAALGKQLTPEQFLVDKAAQEAVFRHRFGSYVDKYGEEGAARAWFGGEKGMNNPSATDMHGRLTVAGYGQDYLSRLQGGNPRDRAAAALVAQQSPPVRVASADPATPAPQAPPPPASPAPAPPVVAQAPPPAPDPGITKAPPAGPWPRQQPAPPVLLPMINDRIRHWNTIASDPRIDPTERARAMKLIEMEQSQIKAINDQVRSEHAPYQRQYIEEESKSRDPSTLLANEKTRQEIEKGKIPALVEKVDEKYERNPVTGAYEKARIAGVDPNQRPTFQGTEFQGKALVNYGRARLAHEGLAGGGEELLATRGGQAALGSVPLVGQSLQNEKYKQADIHSENFVQAFIRQQSGGAYTATELEKEARGMLPKYGDPPKVLEQKRAQREQFINSMHSIIGPSGQRVVDYDIAQEKAQRQVKQQTIEAEMAGVEKVVGKPYRKGNRTRIWNGSQWEEH